MPMRALHGNLIIERPDASPTDSAIDNYRLRILLVADGTRPCRHRPNHA
jgi:hypothetical protein